MYKYNINSGNLKKRSFEKTFYKNAALKTEQMAQNGTYEFSLSTIVDFGTLGTHMFPNYRTVVPKLYKAHKKLLKNKQQDNI